MGNVGTNYKKGRKHDLLKILQLTGSIPYSSLRLFPRYSTRMMQRAVKELEVEGVVGVGKNGGKRQVYLTNFQDKNPEYKEAFPALYKDMYSVITSKDRSRALYGKKADAQRVLRNTETYVLMQGAGVNVAPDEKVMLLSTNVIDKTVVCYYTSREVKNYGNFEVKVDEKEKLKDGTKKINSSRLTGLLVSPGGRYGIYNVGSSLIEWQRYGEIKMAEHLGKLLGDKYAGAEDKSRINQAIVLADTDNTLIQIVTETKKSKRGVPLLNIDYAYNCMYGICVSTEGQKMLKIMTRPEWKIEMMDSFIEKPYQNLNNTTSVPCNGYNEDTGEYTMLFCIPDMVKLKGFVARSIIDSNENKKFKIYCFTHQLAFISKIAGASCEIFSVNLEEYIMGLENQTVEII